VVAIKAFVEGNMVVAY